MIGDSPIGYILYYLSDLLSFVSYPYRTPVSSLVDLRSVLASSFFPVVTGLTRDASLKTLVQCGTIYIHLKPMPCSMGLLLVVLARSVGPFNSLKSAFVTSSGYLKTT